MKAQQVVLIGALGLAAYFFFRSKMAEAVTPVTGFIPGVAAPTAPRTKYGVSASGISYMDKNLSVEIPTGAVKNVFADIWTAITKGDNKETIQGTSNIMSSEVASGFLL